MKKHKLGISVHPWWINGDLKKLEQELCAIEQTGADYCELVLHGLDVVVGGKIVPVRLRQVKQILSERSLRYTLHLPYELNLLDAEAGKLYEKVFLAGIDFANETGCELIVYHAGCAQGDPERLIGQELEIMSRLLKAAGCLPICMENGPFYDQKEHSMGSTAQNMTEFCRLVSHANFKLTFDVGHNYMNNRGNPEKLLEDIDLLLPYIGHVHLHDNFGIPIKMEQCDYSHRIACGAADIHLPLGWGNIPITAVLQKLEGYDGIINLEIEKRFEDQYGACIQYMR